MGDTNYCSICGGEINGEPLRHSAVLVKVDADFSYPTWKCSDCGEEYVFADDFYGTETPEDFDMNYCPSCGAKIVGFRYAEEEEGDGGDME